MRLYQYEMPGEALANRQHLPADTSLRQPWSRLAGESKRDQPADADAIRSHERL